MIFEERTSLQGYQFLDSGVGPNGPARLERFGAYVLSRPDPQAIWQCTLPKSEWDKADAVFAKPRRESKESRATFQGLSWESPDSVAKEAKNSAEDREPTEEWQGGKWHVNNKQMPEKWLMDFSFGGAAATEPAQKIQFYAKLNPFKHTGVFPEQSSNWKFMAEKIMTAQKRNPDRKIKFLNLFGYTGIASVLAAKLGCEVTHVDASKPSLTAAKENMLASMLPEDAIRWILDDAAKFVKREVKRGNKYDCILLDPPAFGRGAKGEVWKFGEDLPPLLENLSQICTPDFEFVIINAYAVSVSSLLLKNLLEDFGKAHGAVKAIDYGELVLAQESNPKRMLSTGIFARLY